ncbi:PREDICTED: L10-interacting MYB domain-containing protein-like [Camelina sativa]|uniref:L10-interacting MYB domain-containing protein-like n=1 Tax=Camelina sativa TaxID=90675 RepID=A0ABM0W2P6_CAMSA|nr:PREDICTED: L10-interacting MYB domain-containing protein-like [Camelina sativa]
MTPRVWWQPEHHRHFVELCVEHKAHLPRMQHILKPFQQSTGTRFTILQLKDHWNTMLKNWKIWSRLVQCSDMKWDPQTKTFGASDQDWTNYLQVNPEAKPYRWKWPPLFLEKLEIIFKAVNVDDDEGTSGSRKRKRSCEHRDKENDTGDEATLSASNIWPRRCVWSSSSHDLFVELCFQESSKGNRPTRGNKYYPKETWDMMAETINQETGSSYTQAQLKSRWVVTKEEWRLWCNAVGNPIMKWDDNTCKFGATHEDWENFLKVNRKAAKFRWRNIPHAVKLATIFRHIQPGNAQPRTYRRTVIDHHSEAPQLHEPAPSSAVYINEPVTEGSDHAS